MCGERPAFLEDQTSRNFGYDFENLSHLFHENLI